MSRPLCIEFPGAVYHVTSRGDQREAIYRDDADRLAQLDILAQAMDRFDAQVLAYRQMGNHFHLVLHTRAANLSRLMRHLNGASTPTGPGSCQLPPLLLAQPQKSVGAHLTNTDKPASLPVASVRRRSFSTTMASCLS